MDECEKNAVFLRIIYPNQEAETGFFNDLGLNGPGIVQYADGEIEKASYENDNFIREMPDLEF